jgi:hypothetical protein
MPTKKRPSPDGFVLNEPRPRIPGGARRKSIIVSRSTLPGIRQRERVNALLLAHDLEPPIPEPRRIFPPLLRQVAIEGAISNQIPARRYNAILRLARDLTAENLDLLEELARYGDDAYVRGHALVALGTTGLRLVGPVLRDGLAAADTLERDAAVRGLRALAARQSVGLLRQLAQDEARTEVGQRLREVIAAIERGDGGRRKREARRTTTPRE